MNGPPRWSDDSAPRGLEGQAAEAMRLMREQESWSRAAQAQQWAEIEARIELQRAWRGRAVVALLATVAVAVLAVWQGRSLPAGSREIAMGELGSLSVGPATVIEIPPNLERREGERVVRLMSGRVEARIAKQREGSAFVITTAQLRVTVVGTRFVVGASAERSSVEVSEGVVRVEQDGFAVLLRAGERIASDDPRLSPPIVPSKPCAAEPSVALRRACYEALAPGDGLAAQNALYALGMLALNEEKMPERAMAHWLEYERRFSTGALRPEVMLAILEISLARGDASTSAARAADFLARFATHPRAAEVALVQADVWCRSAKTAPQARAALRALDQNVSDAVREKAAWGAVQCEVSLRNRSLLRVAVEKYVRDFPAGEHVEAARRLRR